MSRNADDRFRFLITVTGSDLDDLDSAAKRLRMSRTHYVVLAIRKALADEPKACPICGRTETHSH